MKSAIFWDLENVPVINNFNPSVVSQALADYAFHHSGGNLIQFLAFGNKGSISNKHKTNFLRSGCGLVECGTKNPPALALLKQLWGFTLAHKAPCVIVLVSGNDDFAEIVSFLQSHQYSVHLVYSDIANISRSLLEIVGSNVLLSSLIDKFPGIKSLDNNSAKELLPDVLEPFKLLCSTIEKLAKTQGKNFVKSNEIVTHLNGNYGGYKKFSSYLIAAKNAGLVVLKEVGNGQFLVTLSLKPTKLKKNGNPLKENKNKVVDYEDESTDNQETIKNKSSSIITFRNETVDFSGTLESHDNMKKSKKNTSSIKNNSNIHSGNSNGNSKASSEQLHSSKTADLIKNEQRQRQPLQQQLEIDDDQNKKNIILGSPKGKKKRSIQNTEMETSSSETALSASSRPITAKRMVRSHRVDDGETIGDHQHQRENENNVIQERINRDTHGLEQEDRNKYCKGKVEEEKEGQTRGNLGTALLFPQQSSSAPGLYKVGGDLFDNRREYRVGAGRGKILRDSARNLQALSSLSSTDNQCCTAVDDVLTAVSENSKSKKRKSLDAGMPKFRGSGSSGLEQNVGLELSLSNEGQLLKGKSLGSVTLVGGTKSFLKAELDHLIKEEQEKPTKQMKKKELKLKKEVRSLQDPKKKGREGAKKEAKKEAKSRDELGGKDRKVQSIGFSKSVNEDKNSKLTRIERPSSSRNTDNDCNSNVNKIEEKLKKANLTSNAKKSKVSPPKKKSDVQLSKSSSSPRLSYASENLFLCEDGSQRCQKSVATVPKKTKRKASIECRESGPRTIDRSQNKVFFSEIAATMEQQQLEREHQEQRLQLYFDSYHHHSPSVSSNYREESLESPIDLLQQQQPQQVKNIDLIKAKTRPNSNINSKTDAVLLKSVTTPQEKTDLDKERSEIQSKVKSFTPERDFLPAELVDVDVDAFDDWGGRKTTTVRERLNNFEKSGISKVKKSEALLEGESTRVDRVEGQEKISERENQKVGQEDVNNENDKSMVLVKFKSEHDVSRQFSALSSSSDHVKGDMHISLSGRRHSLMNVGNEGFNTTVITTTTSRKRENNTKKSDGVLLKDRKPLQHVSGDDAAESVTDGKGTKNNKTKNNKTLKNNVNKATMQPSALATERSNEANFSDYRPLYRAMKQLVADGTSLNSISVSLGMEGKFWPFKDLPEFLHHASFLGFITIQSSGVLSLCQQWQLGPHRKDDLPSNFHRLYESLALLLIKEPTKSILSSKISTLLKGDYGGYKKLSYLLAEAVELGLVKLMEKPHGVYLVIPCPSFFVGNESGSKGLVEKNENNEVQKEKEKEKENNSTSLESRKGKEIEKESNFKSISPNFLQLLKILIDLVELKGECFQFSSAEIMSRLNGSYGGFAKFSTYLRAAAEIGFLSFEPGLGNGTYWITPVLNDFYEKKDKKPREQIDNGPLENFTKDSLAMRTDYLKRRNKEIEQIEIPISFEPLYCVIQKLIKLKNDQVVFSSAEILSLLGNNYGGHKKFVYYLQAAEKGGLLYIFNRSFGNFVVAPVWKLFLLACSDKEDTDDIKERDMKGKSVKDRMTPVTFVDNDSLKCVWAIKIAAETVHDKTVKVNTKYEIIQSSKDENDNDFDLCSDVKVDGKNNWENLRQRPNANRMTKNTIGKENQTGACQNESLNRSHSPNQSPNQNQSESPSRSQRESLSQSPCPNQNLGQNLGQSPGQSPSPSPSANEVILPNAAFCYSVSFQDEDYTLTFVNDGDSGTFMNQLTQSNLVDDTSSIEYSTAYDDGIELKHDHEQQHHCFNKTNISTYSSFNNDNSVLTFVDIDGDEAVGAESDHDSSSIADNDITVYESKMRSNRHVSSSPNEANISSPTRTSSSFNYNQSENDLATDKHNRDFDRSCSPLNESHIYNSTSTYSSFNDDTSILMFVDVDNDNGLHHQTTSGDDTDESLTVNNQTTKNHLATRQHALYKPLEKDGDYDDDFNSKLNAFFGKMESKYISDHWNDPLDRQHNLNNDEGGTDCVQMYDAEQRDLLADHDDSGSSNFVDHASASEGDEIATDPTADGAGILYKDVIERGIDNNKNNHYTSDYCKNYFNNYTSNNENDDKDFPSLTECLEGGVNRNRNSMRTASLREMGNKKGNCHNHTEEGRKTARNQDVKESGLGKISGVTDSGLGIDFERVIDSVIDFGVGLDAEGSIPRMTRSGNNSRRGSTIDSGEENIWGLSPSLHSLNNEGEHFGISNIDERSLCGIESRKSSIRRRNSTPALGSRDAFDIWNNVNRFPSTSLHSHSPSLQSHSHSPVPLITPNSRDNVEDFGIWNDKEQDESKDESHDHRQLPPCGQLPSLASHSLNSLNTGHEKALTNEITPATLRQDSENYHLGENIGPRKRTQSACEDQDHHVWHLMTLSSSLKRPNDDDNIVPHSLNDMAALNTTATIATATATTTTTTTTNATTPLKDSFDHFYNETNLGAGSEIQMFKEVDRE